MYNLDYYGIRGSTHKWIALWLSGRSQTVPLDGQASYPVPVLSCVLQGSVLARAGHVPIFINDLPETIRSSVRLFADDCVLFRNIKSPMDCQMFQDGLNSLAQWETDWHPHDNQIKFDYSLHQQNCEQVQSTKYLGITITDILYWGQHISEIACKATKTMDFVRPNKA